MPERVSAQPAKTLMAESPGRVRNEAAAGPLAAASASLAVVATLVGSAIEGFGSSAEGHLPSGLVASGLAGVTVVVVAAWVVGPSRPPVSIGLAVMTVGLTAPLWAAWPSLQNGARAGLLAVTPFVVAGTAQVALGWSGAGRRRPVRTVYLLVTAGAVVHLLAYNPFAEPGCTTVCFDVRPVAGDILHPRSALALTGVLMLAGALVAAVAVVRAQPPKAPRMVAGAVLVALTGTVLPVAVRWAGWGDQRVSQVLLVLPVAAAVLVGAAVTAATIRTWRTRASLGRLVARLADVDATAGDLSGMVGEVQFALPDAGGWADAMGRPVGAESRDGRYVVVSGRSGPALRLLLARGNDDGDLSAVLTPAIRLSLMNAQLAAVTRARVAEVQASRRRVVAASDAERRRIERDLHDGAQQRLVGATFYLNLARARVHDDIPTLVAAEEAVRDALGHLRRLAHGVFPGVLATEGLWGALDEMVRASVVPATLEVSGDDGIDTATAMAAYATVAAALDRAGHLSQARAVRVSGHRESDALVVSVEVTHDGDPPESSDFTDEDDRVGALGGDLTVSSTRQGTIVAAVLPCES